MNILVTAGNTQILIDQVRCLTNIFSGRTGASISLHAAERGHAVTLLISKPEVVAALDTLGLPRRRWHVDCYRTFEDLQELMQRHLTSGRFDAVIHAAAVSDYRAAGVFTPESGSHFDPATRTWHREPAGRPGLRDVSAGKVKSSHRELWLRLVPTPKLIDQVRTPWGFRGVLVKFKLEVGLNDEDLLHVAEAARQHSSADLMVANTLEGAAAWAYLGPLAGRYERLSRRELPARLLEAIERLYEESTHG